TQPAGERRQQGDQAESLGPPGEQLAELQSGHAPDVRVPGVADAEVVPYERAAGAEHPSDLGGHLPCDPVVEDRGEQGEAEREIEAGVAIGQRYGVADVEAQRGKAGVRARDGVRAEVDAREAAREGAPANEAGQDLAVAAADVEHATAVERQATGLLEQ